MMILQPNARSSPRPSTTSNAEAVARLRLAQFQHSTDQHVAVIATAVSLLLPRFDRLLAAMEGER